MKDTLGVAETIQKLARVSAADRPESRSGGDEGLVENRDSKQRVVLSMVIATIGCGSRP